MNFNTRTVAQIIGLTQRQIDYWDKTHFIKPSIKEAAGYGSTRLFSFEDLVRMKVAKTLMDKGISLQKIRKAVSYLKRNMPDVEHPLSDLKFLTDGETVFVLTKDTREIIDTLKNGQLVISVSLGSIIDGLKGEVHDLSGQRTYEVTVMKKKYPVILHADTEDGGYWVECPDIPGCASQGDTLEEALAMIKDAITGCLETLAKKKKAASAS
ncbi:MAG: MerR family transcriptional regulator [Desulforhabdus sp.]|nr:MerR family transcriptional regulator [Desulforhabdus sp.]